MRTVINPFTVSTRDPKPQEVHTLGGYRPRVGAHWPHPDLHSSSVTTTDRPAKCRGMNGLTGRWSSSWTPTGVSYLGAGVSTWGLGCPILGLGCLPRGWGVLPEGWGVYLGAGVSYLGTGVSYLEAGVSTWGLGCPTWGLGCRSGHWGVLPGG